VEYAIHETYWPGNQIDICSLSAVHQVEAGWPVLPFLAPCFCCKSKYCSPQVAWLFLLVLHSFLLAPLDWLSVLLQIADVFPFGRTVLGLLGEALHVVSQVPQLVFVFQRATQQFLYPP